MSGYIPPPKEDVKSSFSAQLAAMLTYHQIDLVLDVGANRGQYAQKLRRLGYTGNIISFEPQATIREIAAQAAQADPDWRVYPAIAIGAQNEQLILQNSAEDDMSSLHRQTAMHRKVSPSSAVIGTETVSCRRLDTLLDELQVGDRRIMLKSDTQGHESAVLDGLGAWLGMINMIQLELPLSPLYEEAASWHQMIDRLTNAGYELHGLKPGYFERKIARMLECDAVFVRSS